MEKTESSIIMSKAKDIINDTEFEELRFYSKPQIDKIAQE